MSELKEAAKKELFSKISIHSLAHLTSGVREINLIDKTLRKGELTKRFKGGWILEADFNENYDTIVQWDQTREVINDLRREIRELDEGVVSMRDQIANVESGRWEAWRPMLPRYKDNLERWQKSLAINNIRLETAKAKFKPLKASIKSLKDNFKLYISQLEAEEAEG